MTNTNKKEWSTPKLRVFVRSRMEERVLENCKHSYPSSGSLNRDRMCWYSTSCFDRCEGAPGS